MEFPFLKSLRFSAESPLVKNYIKDLNSFPKGLSLLHIAVYTRDLQMLDLLLQLELKVRTQKKKGGISAEDSPFHVSIKTNFQEGAEKILEYEGYTSFAGRSRFRV